jgi:hypothetical protein
MNKFIKVGNQLDDYMKWLSIVRNLRKGLRNKMEYDTINYFNSDFEFNEDQPTVAFKTIHTS